MTDPRVIGIVADDVTGAADSAGAFAAHGWRVLLLADGEAASPEPGTVLAVVAHNRALPDEEARTASERATARLASVADRLFVKIDSTVRGSVASQIRGALTEWARVAGDAHALVCPAFPAQSRTVRGGVVFVDGVPVHETPSGQDPITPVRSSDLAQLLQAPDVATEDAATDADLDRIARRIADDARTVAVGSAGLAHALARTWSRGAVPAAPLAAGGRVLVAVSSRLAVTRRQVDVLGGAEGISVISATDRTDLSPDRAAALLADDVRTTLDSEPIDSLIVCGGDGLAAVLARLGAHAVRIDRALADGCPSGVIVGGAHDGLRIVTKSGGFGGPRTLLDLADALRSARSTKDDPS